MAVVVAALAPVLPYVFTNDAAVIDRATSGLWWLAAILIPGGIAFAYDGVLIGAGDYRFLGRAAFFYSLALAPVAVLILLYPALGIGGIWAGILLWMCLRAASIIAIPDVSCRSDAVDSCGEWCKVNRGVFETWNLAGGIEVGCHQHIAFAPVIRHEHGVWPQAPIRPPRDDRPALPTGEHHPVVSDETDRFCRVGVQLHIRPRRLALLSRNPLGLVARKVLSQDSASGQHEREVTIGEHTRPGVLHAVKAGTTVGVPEPVVI